MLAIWLSLSSAAVALAANFQFAHDPVSLQAIQSLASFSRDSGDEIYLNDGVSRVSRSLTELNQTVDISVYGPYRELFEKMAFPQDQYVRFQGMDWTSLYATSVAISNDFAIIGSNGYNIYQGVVHVYTPVSVSEWQPQSVIYSPDGPNINFGLSVARSGNFLIVGANALDAYKGAAYIYQLMNNQYWILVKKIYSPFGVTQGFGFKVAIDGYTAVVSTAINNVCIYEYDTVSSSWSGPTILQGDGENDKFGNSIDIYGDYLVVGAPHANSGVGTAYVFNRDSINGNWSRTSLNSTFNTQYNYGFSVSIFNGTIAVGATGFRLGTFKPLGQDSDDNIGYTYLYKFDSPSSQFLLYQSIPSPVGHLSYFGAFVGLANNKLIVGADGAYNANNTGAAFVYFYNTSTLTYELEYALPSPAGDQGHFGYAVDICDDYAVSGAYGFDDLRGSVYLIGFPQPTPAPTLPPTGGSSSSLGFTAAVVKQQKMLQILAIGVLALVSALTTACCVYLCCIPAVPKKKKKEEEEESPYTVHSYVGYSEMDEYMPPQAPPPQWMPFFPQVPMPTMAMPMMMPPPPMMMMMPPPMMDMDKKKELDSGAVDLKKVDENFVRKLFPYKVYSYAGYEENQGSAVDQAMREKRELEKSGSSSSDEDDRPLPSQGHVAQYGTPVNISTYNRRPFSMETITEQENEDDTSLSSEDRQTKERARGLPYTMSSHYGNEGFQQYDPNNASQFISPGVPPAPPMSQPLAHGLAYPPGYPQSMPPSNNLYGATQGHIFMHPAAAGPAPSAISSDEVSVSSSSYVSMAKEHYARFKNNVRQHRSPVEGTDEERSHVPKTSSSDNASLSHSEQVRQYASEKSSGDLVSTTSGSDDSYVQRAKQRYMQFVTRKNMTREEREAEDALREQAYQQSAKTGSSDFLRAGRIQPRDNDEDDDENDNATVSTMTDTVVSNSTGFYSESTQGSDGTGSQRTSSVQGGSGLALNLGLFRPQSQPRGAEPSVSQVVPASTASASSSSSTGVTSGAVHVAAASALDGSDTDQSHALAQSIAAEEELKRVQERNRIKEEARLRAEERARAQFAMHKQRAEAATAAKQQQQQTQQSTSAPVAAMAPTSSGQALSRSSAPHQQILQGMTAPSHVDAQTTPEVLRSVARSGASANNKSFQEP